MQLNGIDVSKWQGTIDFNQVKSAGIQFAIIRAGYGKELNQKDPKFEENYSNAKLLEFLLEVIFTVMRLL